MSETTADADAMGHDDQDDHHDPSLAHHFDSYQQQFDAGKLGIWLFLVTEILFFSGLFCAYATYRSLHPEIFEYAHYFLDSKLGALNTAVLLISSLTAAWAVRCAQLENKKGLIINIVVTIACAFTFMGVKYMEYSHKFHDGLLPGNHFAPAHTVASTPAYQARHPEAVGTSHGAHSDKANAHDGKAVATKEGEDAAAKGAPTASGKGVDDPNRPPNAHIFFGIYFFMTGLHGIHVMAGIIVWVWLLVRAVRGRFTRKYFGPIDFAALYWHLVDLVWIYLFPLLYLID